jgi:hypothetical protein
VATPFVDDALSFVEAIHLPLTVGIGLSAAAGSG